MTAGRSKNKLAVRDMRISRGANGNFLLQCVLTPKPIEIREGTTIDYQLRLRGVPIRWRSLISCWEPPLRFVDEPLRGPCRWWRHEHVFEAVGDETLCRDAVEYSVPGGRLVNWMFVQRELKRIFRYRQVRLAELLS